MIGGRALTEIAHLQMIQDIVIRLAGQSTNVKGWAITVTSALLGYGVSQHEVILTVVACYAILGFASLDAYYLALERAYRQLFAEAVGGNVDAWALKANHIDTNLFLRAFLSV